MARYILILALVIAAPFVVWGLWRLIRGGPGAATPTRLLITVSAGATVLALLILGVLGLNEGSRDGVYTPPSLQDGQVRPGRFEEREQAPSDEPIRS